MSDPRAHTSQSDANAASTSPPTNILVVTDLHKSYDGVEVLKGISLSARRGETTVLLGGSGAGKTTLLHLIVALEPPTSGSIVVDGEEMVGLSEHKLNDARRKFGMVYQYAALLDSETVMNNVAFPLVEHSTLSMKEIHARVLAQLKSLGLQASVATEFSSELSGGMRKRVGIARALMLDPPIMVYDEPTSGLDPPMSRQVDDLIEHVRERYGVTSIVSSHDITSCFRIAHHVILLMDGKIAAEGTPDELANGTSDVARAFIEKSGVDVRHVSRVPSGTFPRAGAVQEGVPVPPC
jgi:phospholipid/cholesterol/gamma-HCH transport system ATP-binding protein